MFCRRALITALVTALSCALLAGCERAASAPRHSDALVIARFAGEVTFTRSQGQEEMRYVVQDEFPAEDVLAFIRTELGRRNWKPLRHDLLNPAQLSSHLRGWDQVDDAKPEQPVREWTAQWENDNHDIVSYRLEFRAAKDGSPDLRTLHVTGAYMPAETAARVRAAAQPRASR